MSYWLESSESIPDGLGFSLFSGLHVGWLVVFVLCVAVCCVLYRRLSAKGRKVMRYAVAGAVVADEILLITVLIIGGNLTVQYLPVHLCSVNLFLIAWHAWRPGNTLGNFLYTVNIPGAIAALLFPSWTDLPLANISHIHSFTFHILLVVYPAMQMAGGDLRVDAKSIPKCLALLAGLACVALGVNLLCDTNFMFLMEADEGNPLKLFEDLWGSHLWGFVVIIPAVLVVMHGPILLVRRISVHSKNRT